MILCSYVAFLNVVTQMLDGNTLLNADYYPIDIVSPTDSFNVDMECEYDEFGIPTQHQFVEKVPNGITPYNIHYDASLTPIPYITDTCSTIQNKQLAYETAKGEYIKSLNSREGLVNVYRYLFKNPLQGNGVQIMLIFDDNLIKQGYGDIIAQHISKIYGENVIFIDKKYREDIPGYEIYAGDTMNAPNNINQIRDMELIIQYNAQISCKGEDELVNNLQTFLGNFDISGLFHLYELLFPEAPLPQGNYYPEQIINMIIDGTNKGIDYNQTKNQMNNRFLDYINRYS